MEIIEKIKSSKSMSGIIRMINNSEKLNNARAKRIIYIFNLIFVKLQSVS